MDQMDAAARPRTRFALPWTAAEAVLPAPEVPFEVVWNGARNLPLRTDGDSGEIAVETQNRRWRFAAAAEPILRMLLAGRRCSLGVLKAAAPGLPAETVAAFLRELVANGLVAVVPDERRAR
jgi:hypothetical protein